MFANDCLEFPPEILVYGIKNSRLLRYVLHGKWLSSKQFPDNVKTPETT